MAEPISSPRRSRGAAPISHPSAPAHEQAPPTPWTNRAASSSTTSFAVAKTIPDAESRPSPVKTVGRTPTRDASNPAGMLAVNVPAA